MGTPQRVSETATVRGPYLVLTAILLNLSGVTAGVAAAQQPTPVTKIAAATTGVITGQIIDERGLPLSGVVVSATGGITSFAISDRVGQYTLRALTPGPYLVRAHRDGYLPGRNTMVNVRPSSRTVSTFTLKRLASAANPRVATAGVGGTEITADPKSSEDRDESETAWRLRHLRRSILKETTALAEAPANHDFFLTDSLQLVGRAMESSARIASALFTSPLQGQVNLFTTGTFDNPAQLLQLERTRGVAFFSVGAPVREHGDWAVQAALNQGDLSSWILAGNYITRNPARHRYQFGMSYGTQRYEGGNAAALAMSDEARNVGSVYGHDEWRLNDRVILGYGAHYGHYDYLAQEAYLSPRVAVILQHPEDRTRIRAVAARHVTAPGAEEFLPPANAPVLPPQRTFAPLTRAGFNPEDMRHYELSVEQVVDGATIGVRTFYQTIDDQLVTVFGLNAIETGSREVGHYSVGSTGDVDVIGLGVRLSHALAPNVRGTIDYSLGVADWANEPSRDRYRLARSVPAALRNDGERIHDITTTLETEIHATATRVFVLHKINSAYIRPGSERPGLDARWDVQVHQGLPFMSFTNADWEMLVAIRNLFRESFSETSVYDELLVARPPKRLVGGITVKF